MEVVETEEDKEDDLPPVLHKAWEASRLRALNEVLGELQSGELLYIGGSGGSMEGGGWGGAEWWGGGEASFVAAWRASTKEAKGRKQ